MSDIKIYGKLVNSTSDGELAGSNQIYDSTIGEFQSKINSDIKDALGNTSKGLINKVNTLETNLADEIKLARTNEKTNSDAIAILNGSGEGSVSKAVSDGIAKVINGADDKFDTLKEIADWIASDTTRAKDLTTTVTTNKTNIETLTTNFTNHTINYSNPHKVTASQVGLGNVNNTSDIDKPISTAQQSALDLKANKSDVIYKGILEDSEIYKLDNNVINDAVRYTSQIRTDAEKKIARDNIGAIDKSQLDKKQDLLIYDSIPIDNSNNLLKSGVIYTALSKKSDLTHTHKIIINSKEYTISQDSVNIGTYLTEHQSLSAYSTTEQIKTLITSSINTLNAISVGGTGKYVQSISETNGIITATVANFPISLPASDVSAWAKATTKPSYSFDELTSHPTTIGGYGISDLAIDSGVITIGNNKITPLTSINGSTNTEIIITVSGNTISGSISKISSDKVILSDGTTVTSSLSSKANAAKAVYIGEQKEV